MLQRGAVKVFAIDVGKGILHWKLRNDRRVVVMEETNARFVESLPEKINFVTVDASFISLKILLPVIKKWIFPLSSFVNEEEMKEERSVLALIKPQFEAGKKDVSRGDGVIRNPEIHKQVLLDVLNYAKAEGFGLRGLVKSTLLGPKGNVEFLLWMDMKPNENSVEAFVNHVMEEEIAPNEE
jgi:23S rRNA (cytidine1920-2'-O)/16S rRNA (cytidine1409-2'-O)-methyltransferase